MFKRSGSDDIASNASVASQDEQPTRVYVTSIKNITASSPTKTKWSNPSPAAEFAPPSPVRRGLRHLLLRGLPLPLSSLSNSSTSKVDDNSKEPILSDSISGSKRLQNSIFALTQTGSIDEHEVLCCKQDEANDVINALQKRAAAKIDEGKLQGALQYLNKSLALQQKLYGKQHSKVASTLNTMGEVLSNMGEDHRYMAMSALEESLAIHQELEPGGEDTAITLKNLWLLFHESNVAISRASSQTKEMITFQDFDSSAQAVY